MNMILIYPDELGPDGRAILAGERARHIRKVLRAGPGKTLRIGLLDGPFGSGTVESVSAAEVALRCVFAAQVPPRPPIGLLLAMPRPKVLKRLWAQLAALGVGRIILTNAAKVERFYFDTHVLEPAFYTARLIEGLQQARDTRLPEVQVVRELKPFLEDRLDALCPEGRRLLADPSGSQGLFSAVRAGNAPGSRILLAVGPEGGWTPYELDLFRAHRFEVFGMGERILRTDTACIGLLTLLAEAVRDHL